MITIARPSACHTIVIQYTNGIHRRSLCKSYIIEKINKKKIMNIITIFHGNIASAVRCEEFLSVCCCFLSSSSSPPPPRWSTRPKTTFTRNYYGRINPPEKKKSYTYSCACTYGTRHVHIYIWKAQASGKRGKDLWRIIQRFKVSHYDKVHSGLVFFIIIIFKRFYNLYTHTFVFEIT